MQELSLAQRTTWSRPTSNRQLPHQVITQACFEHWPWSSHSAMVTMIFAAVRVALGSRAVVQIVISSLLLVLSSQTKVWRQPPACPLEAPLCRSHRCQSAQPPQPVQCVSRSQCHRRRSSKALALIDISSLLGTTSPVRTAALGGNVQI